MSDWMCVAKEFRAAARDLRESGHFRASLGRCYYAAYAHSSHRLRTVGVVMPRGWFGPRHAPLVNGILYSSCFRQQWSTAEIGKSIHWIAWLYRLRCIADYSPSVKIVRADADSGFAYLLQLESLLAKIDGGNT